MTETEEAELDPPAQGRGEEKADPTGTTSVETGEPSKLGTRRHTHKPAKQTPFVSPPVCQEVEWEGQGHEEGQNNHPTHAQFVQSV